MAMATSTVLFYARIDHICVRPRVLSATSPAFPKIASRQGIRPTLSKSCSPGSCAKKPRWLSFASRITGTADFVLNFVSRRYSACMILSRQRCAQGVRDKRQPPTQCPSSASCESVTERRHLAPQRPPQSGHALSIAPPPHCGQSLVNSLRVQFARQRVQITSFDSIIAI